MPNGKPDLPALIAPSEVDSQVVAGDLLDSLRRAFEQSLGYGQVAESASFVQLGGDSLSFVEVSIRLEELLGDLPNGWPEMSIRELAATLGSFPEPASTSEPAPAATTRRPRVAWLDTSIVLRALAITMVVVVHLEIWGVRGGAHLLLGIAGFTFARFQLSAIRQSDRIGGLARSITRLAVPSVLFIAAVVVATGEYSVANIFLVLPRLLVVAGCLLAGMIMAAAVTIGQRNIARVWRGAVIALHHGPTGTELDTTARSIAVTR